MRKILLFVEVACFLLLCGCQTNDVETPKRSNIPNPSSEEELMVRYSSINVPLLISENPDLYGTPLVFDSLENVDALLDELSEMDYTDLRDWYSNAGFYSPVIESNIICDSVYDEHKNNVLAEYGFANEEYLEIYPALLDEIEARYSYDMMNNFSDYCYSREVFNEATNESSLAIYPLGIMDIEALCNEKSLFIVDKIVYKIQNGCIMTSYMDTYEDVAQFLESDNPYLYYALEAQGTPNYNFMVAPLCVAYDDEEHNQTYHKEYSEGGHYALEIVIEAYPILGWFCTNARGRTTITNYYKGKRYKAQVGGDIVANATAYYNGSQYSLPFHWPNSYIYGKYKRRTLRHTWTNLISGWRLSQVQILIDTVTIYASQNNGRVIINY